MTKLKSFRKLNCSGFSVVELLIIGLVLGSVGVVSYSVVKKNAPKNNTPDTTSKTPAQKTSTSSSTLCAIEKVTPPAKKTGNDALGNAYSGYKTYDNKEYGISFAYPSSWSVDEQKNSSTGKIEYVHLRQDQEITEQFFTHKPEAIAINIEQRFGLRCSDEVAALKSKNLEFHDTSGYYDVNAEEGVFYGLHGIKITTTSKSGASEPSSEYVLASPQMNYRISFNGYAFTEDRNDKLFTIVQDILANAVLGKQ